MNEKDTADYIRTECALLADVLTAKHENYGKSAFQEPALTPGMDPETAMMVRLSDKIARLRSLQGGEPDKVGESKLDTLLDMAGYAVLLRVYSRIRNSKCFCEKVTAGPQARKVSSFS